MFEISTYHAHNISVSLWLYHNMSILCFILHRTVDHRLVKTIGQFVYLTVQVNLKCKWDSRDIESIKYGTIGIKPTNVSKKNLWKPDIYIILLNYHFCMLFASGQMLHTEQRILYCYIYIIKSTWIIQLSFLLHISSVSIFHFLHYKHWRGGTCFWTVIFLLQPVIWSPLSEWWHDVSAMSRTCHKKICVTTRSHNTK